MAEAGPSEEYSNSLLDCQRGEDPEKYDENGDPISRSKGQMVDGLQIGHMETTKRQFRFQEEDTTRGDTLRPEVRMSHQ